ncbi:MAG: NADH-quinone oxidoreductase subunit NuoH [Breznakibacter sp.]
MSFSIYDFTQFTHALHESLSASLTPTATLVVEFLIVGVLFLSFYALLGLFLVYAERKVCAFIQNRLGPNRVGPLGMFQTIADLIKLLMKELILIKHSDRILYNIAPFIVIIASMMAIGSVPFAPGLHALDFNIGILYVVAITSLGVIGILLAGWSSNSKYSLIGAMRSGAQMVSYELSIGLALLPVVMLCGSLQFSSIIASQADGWWIFKGHIPVFIAFVIFLIASTAETNRGPFDLAEAESELTAGFHTEYSGIRFAFFFLAEYMNMFLVAAIAATVFLGGWQPLHFGGFEAFNHIMDFIPPIIWFFGKTFAIIYIIMLFKWTFPRLRIDQLLRLEWKYLLPLNMMNIIVMALIILMGWHF